MKQNGAECRWRIDIHGLSIDTAIYRYIRYRYKLSMYRLESIDIPIYRYCIAITSEHDTQPFDVGQMASHGVLTFPGSWIVASVTHMQQIEGYAKKLNIFSFPMKRRNIQFQCLSFYLLHTCRWRDDPWIGYKAMHYTYTHTHTYRFTPIHTFTV